MLRKAYENIRKNGDRLAETDTLIDWEAFRPIITLIYHNKTPRGGRPNIDLVVMVQCAHSAYRFDPRLRSFYESNSKWREGRKAVVAVAHEMIRIVFFMLKRGEAYRGEKRGVTEKKFKKLGEDGF